MDDENLHRAFSAATHGDTATLSKLIEEEKVSINIKDHYGNTLLHWACYRQHIDTIKYLLRNGIKTDEKNNEEHQTPLHWAILSGNLQVIQLLRQYNICDYETPDRRGYNSLILATQNGFMKIVHYLHFHKVNLDYQDASFATPLHWASLKGYHDIVRYLLKAGADPTLRDVYGSTCLHWSCFNDCVDVVLVYMKLISDRSFFEIQDVKGKTALDYSYKHQRVRKLLLNYARKSELPFSERNMKLIWFFIPWFVYILFTITSLAGLNTLLIAFILFASIFALKSLLSPYFSLHEKNPIVIGFFYSTFVFTMACYFYYCFTYDLRYNTMKLCFILFVATLMIVLHLQLIYGDPGFVSIDKETDSRLFLESIDQGEYVPEICSTCHIRKPLRSKHCPVMDKCVVSFDHYCVWIYNSVGIKNHRKFMILLLLGFVAHFIILVPFIKAFFRELPESPSLLIVLKTMSSHIFLMAAIILQIINVIWEAQLIFTQISLILRGMTYNEYIYWHKYPVFQKVIEDGRIVMHNPFNRGRLQNFLDFWTQKHQNYFMNLYDINHVRYNGF